ncbi:conserved hypothetical protein [Uncinocarpus reesii 1704]|uniref:6-phosphogluconate dehydrogenase NADP-binding domain-containing protein n=1 Tax=Uncinocarpus reesii (strain UAMH 1704) TaxID=336963 RepID=C4JP13_UNCRE|nr:uncharacterized protein UREG_03072 [Uncinocarpus reesii 1704]EEP78227.1 conserved hypothetical protein [Uncinocarpus reesii 1704]
MGRGMVRNLVAKASLAHPLTLYNRSPARAVDLAASLPPGTTTVAASIADAVRPASIVFTCLGDDTAVESTITAALAADITDKLFVDCSTVHPDTSRRLEALLQSHGAHFIACPVFGAPPAADAGQLVCVQAGKKALVARVQPYFAGVMGRANIDLSAASEDPGRAGMLKVLGNAMIFQMVSAVAEGMVAADKSGLGVDPLHRFLEAVFPGPYVGYSTRMLAGDYYTRDEPLFAVDWARKDVAHALDLAGGVGVEMKGVERIDDYLKEVKDKCGEKGDIAGIYGIARERAGLKFENNPFSSKPELCLYSLVGRRSLVKHSNSDHGLLEWQGHDTMQATDSRSSKDKQRDVLVLPKSQSSHLMRKDIKGLQAPFDQQLNPTSNPLNTPNTSIHHVVQNPPHRRRGPGRNHPRRARRRRDPGAPHEGRQM